MAYLNNSNGRPCDFHEEVNRWLCFTIPDQIEVANAVDVSEHIASGFEVLEEWEMAIFNWDASEAPQDDLAQVRNTMRELTTRTGQYESYFTELDEEVIEHEWRYLTVVVREMQRKLLRVSRRAERKIRGMLADQQGQEDQDTAGGEGKAALEDLEIRLEVLEEIIEDMRAALGSEHCTIE
ncbi:uncharacterized protein E0L32_006019 [Thyridium curvatum]|uniref:Uncharacterized protein n=1 Tax=Thyridium curvatum TaxID=1093900 RepID=A0A507B9T9_9PEZI|nr:uncharacterized protein E0L32_006019 [Thyridium curvatum]TPX13548.1 hypothetical protein E0L32_006019 [Thyridium curvatum]